MARRFRITTAWCTDDGEAPWLLDAYDEIGEDEWAGIPDHFGQAVGKAMQGGAQVRIVNLFVDYDAIAEHFKAGSLDVAEISLAGEAPGSYQPAADGEPGAPTGEATS